MFAVWLNFVSCDIAISESHVFALCHFHIVFVMYRAKLRDVCIHVVASVCEEGGVTTPLSLQLSLRIGFAAPVIEDCIVNAIVTGTTSEYH